MKSLYQFILEEKKKDNTMKFYNLSYDIKGASQKEDKLENRTFVQFLYDQKIISKDVEFLFVDKDNKLISTEKRYAVSPAETTIIFGSGKASMDIIKILGEHEELNFALQELEVKKQVIQGLIINHYDNTVDVDLKKEPQKQTPKLNRMLQMMDIEPYVIKVKVIVK